MKALDIVRYNLSRPVKAWSKVCHAPFTSLNFDQDGNITACCFNRTDVLGKYPDQSIKEVWNGAKSKELRNKIDNNKLDGGCKLCKIMIDSGNYSGTKATHYDEYASSYTDKLKGSFSSDKGFPKVFEFELSNTCNLACEMCNGYFSSTIRKQREQLDPIVNPYDDKFVDQVAEFMPYLTDLKFLGGEPFLIDVYYKIWDRLIEVNPKINVHITTNGTILNNKVKELLSKLNVGIVISIDSIIPEELESIRLGSKHEKILSNFEYFLKVAKEKKTYLSISACAMNNNWKGIPELIRFANQKMVPIHFNVVWNPGFLSLRYLSFKELEQVEMYFLSQSLPKNNKIEEQNADAFNELIGTISYWKKERQNTVSNNKIKSLSLQLRDEAPFKDLNGEHNKEVKSILLEQYDEFNTGDKPVRVKLFELWRSIGDRNFAHAYFDFISKSGASIYKTSDIKGFDEKVEQIRNYVLKSKQIQAVLSDVIDNVDRDGFLEYLNHLNEKTTLELIDEMNAKY